MKINGVISKWNMLGDRIHGICEMRDEYVRAIEQGKPVITSTVQTIFMKDGKRYATTLNSTYLLID